MLIDILFSFFLASFLYRLATAYTLIFEHTLKSSISNLKKTKYDHPLLYSRYLHFAFLLLIMICISDLKVCMWLVIQVRMRRWLTSTRPRTQWRPVERCDWSVTRTVDVDPSLPGYETDDSLNRNNKNLTRIIITTRHGQYRRIERVDHFSRICPHTVFHSDETSGPTLYFSWVWVFLCMKWMTP